MKVEGVHPVLGGEGYQHYEIEWEIELSCTFFRPNGIEIPSAEPSRESTMKPPPPLLIADLLLPDRDELVLVFLGVC